MLKDIHIMQSSFPPDLFQTLMKLFYKKWLTNDANEKLKTFLKYLRTNGEKKSCMVRGILSDVSKKK